ncbi:Predicted arabinose efflux permease, MFS family [Cohnella sp. OV330]|uniref:MFS transporter n=1 Tax=Cohnella sp. OV330 TaxID=1855288 RepID=UPI0008F14011|nr:MFS transporter [Cohnella sp. OV330]SFA74672.1 Predicted arabinose efflux permease, MFS family [Cohnella sp. OV330]
MTRSNRMLIFILTVGVFGILNTEMGVIGLLPAVADRYGISVSQAGWLVSGFALAVAASGPILPLLCSGLNRKTAMLLVLGAFALGNVVSLFATDFSMALAARVLPAFLHPVYCSLAFTVAAGSVRQEDAPKAVSKVFIGVSAGMVVGVPIASFLASAASLQVAMAFFAAVNIAVFLATLLFVPSMPVKERMSYGAQIAVLKKSAVWLSIAAVLFINAAIFGVYSYLAEYLGTVTQLSANAVSILLFVFGGANMIGNVVAGRLLSHRANRSMIVFPFMLAAVYLLLFFTGQFSLPTAILTLVWGILAGFGSNMNQYVMASAAPDAPDFANGLFLTSANLGVTFGASAGGLLIAEWGTSYVVLAGVLSLVLGYIAVLLRNRVLSTAPLHL